MQHLPNQNLYPPQNHFEERLLDQVPAQAPYIALLGVPGATFFTEGCTVRRGWVLKFFCVLWTMCVALDPGPKHVDPLTNGEGVQSELQVPPVGPPMGLCR